MGNLTSSNENYYSFEENICDLGIANILSCVAGVIQHPCQV